MDVRIYKKKMTNEVIREIIQIDKNVYRKFNDYDEKWYFERYSEKNDVFLLMVEKQIAGYFLFTNISQKLFDEICDLKYAEDYCFPVKELNVKSQYYYMPSIVVKKQYKKYSHYLLLKLRSELEKKKNVVVMAVSKEGVWLSEKYLTHVGSPKENKNVKRIY